MVYVVSVAENFGDLRAIATNAIVGHVVQRMTTVTVALRGLDVGRTRSNRTRAAGRHIRQQFGRSQGGQCIGAPTMLRDTPFSLLIVTSRMGRDSSVTLIEAGDNSTTEVADSEAAQHRNA